ncbi:histone-lysine N-methyltransferase ASHR1 [Caerostris darwini]|uniref:Histone-lysine N-methyltransferase ASHR1 n=1 Tax=Caerostris darwini TaxID=1538125 RepID=A0AAV4MRD0_9ARAC|nr:histone-lysine N-methyltransferase ASHR1 [Caerostris darwini]
MISVSEKITHSYCPMFSHFSATEFHELMKNSFGEACYCNDCSQPYGTSTLTKILNPELAVQVIEKSEKVTSVVSLLSHLKYPMDVITQERLKEILEMQEGVLADTHLFRIRILAIKCLLLNGPLNEMRNELLTLLEWVKNAWGPHFNEIAAIYMKLIHVNLSLRDFYSVNFFMGKLHHLKGINEGYP